MSDPVSSMDVEDVLSSIRRLVSEESKASVPARDTQNANQNDQDAARDSDTHDHYSALLGSSAANTARSEGDKGLPPSNEVVASSKLDHDWVSDDKLGNIVRQFTRVDAEAPTQDEQKLVLTAALRVGDDENSKPQEPTVRPIRPLRPERLHLRTVEDSSEDLPPDAPASDAAPRGFKFETAPDDLLFDRAARAMDAVQNNRPTEAPVARIAPAAPESTYDPTDDPAFEISAQVESDPADAEVEPQDTGFGPDEDAIIGHPEASPFHRGFGAFGKSPDMDISAGEQRQSTVPEAGIDAPQDHTQDSYAVADDDDEASTINFAEMDESILDEDTLRELFSQMIREELQGELGDRITRNVRKLVRREIQRALASREFE